MRKLTRDETAEPVSRDQILRHVRGQGDIHFPCSADHEQDWQPYPVDPYSAICDDHTYILHCTEGVPRSEGREGANEAGTGTGTVMETGTRTERERGWRRENQRNTETGT